MSYADQHAERKPRKRREHRTQLEPYRATETERGLGLECPRPDCGTRFIVDIVQIRQRKAEARVRTVTCPCCSRVSLIPEAHLPRELRGTMVVSGSQPPEEER